MVRADTLKSVIEKPGVLQTIVKDTESKARIIGVASQMKLFDFFFGVFLDDLILRHCDNLSQTLQSKKI